MHKSRRWTYLDTLFTEFLLGNGVEENIEEDK
jgi:hypothetical protein